MKNELAYQTNELKLFQTEQKQRNALSRKDLKDADLDIEKAMDADQFYEQVKRTVNHILIGDYDSGILIAYNVINSRMNRPKWLFNHAVSLNFTTSYDRARRSWGKMRILNQVKLQNAILEMMADYDKDPHIKNVF